MRQRGRFTALLWLLSGAISAFAAEPPRQLLRPDSLIGWDYGPTTQGWSLENGKLSSTADALPLLSGWTLGDFELGLAWSVREGGAIQLTFPLAAPLKDRIADRYITPQWHLVLREGDSCGQLFDGTRMIAIGKQSIARRDSHTARFERSGDRVSLVVDDMRLWEDIQATDARWGLQLAVPEGSGQVWDLTLVEPSGEPLFNGQDFAGWETDDPPEAWIVENNEIVCTGKGRDYLRTKADFDNFTLSFDYNLSRRGNSGIGIRTPRGGWPSGDGMELQLYDERPETPLSRQSTMAIYGNLEPLARAEKPSEWNHAVIKAEGYIVSAWINGVLVQHANTMRLPELKYRHLKGWIGLQNHHSPIRYRNVALLAGGEGTGLPAWYVPRKPDASQLVLDRLMNSERLSRADGTRSASVTKSIAHACRTTLAELQGPGALVEFAALGDSAVVGGSRVALYFDGEAEPRIKCPLRDLERRVPPISEGGLPVLTYLPFARSLKIELDANGPSAYRLDHVTFDNGVAVESFRDPERSVARGLLPAVSYRHKQMDGGRLRERDPYRLETSGAKSLEEGQAIELLHVSGPGVIDWWTIAPLSVLANDDLWLEVSVDGDTEPAITAPARYLFPGLGDERDWHNFVLTHSEGATNRLAMPFADGIKIVARYRGKSSPGQITCTASIHPAAEEPQAPLRGAFAEGAAIDLSRAGRLVGLVTATAAPGQGNVQIVADGNRRANETLDLFLGIRSGDDQRGFLAGRSAGLAWRYLLLSPVDFARTLRVEATEEGKSLPALVLFYGK